MQSVVQTTNHPNVARIIIIIMLVEFTKWLIHNIVAHPKQLYLALYLVDQTDIVK